MKINYREEKPPQADQDKSQAAGRAARSCLAIEFPVLKGEAARSLSLPRQSLAFLVSAALHGLVLLIFIIPLLPVRSGGIEPINIEIVRLPAQKAGGGENSESGEVARPRMEEPEKPASIVPKKKTSAIERTAKNRKKNSKSGEITQTRAAAQAVSGGKGADPAGQKVKAGSGSGSVLASGSLAAVYKPEPAYPPLARKRGQQGRVEVRCVVDSAGIVIDAQVVNGSGHRLLDEAALKGVYAWRFQPETGRGQARIVIPVEFRLH